MARRAWAALGAALLAASLTLSGCGRGGGRDDAPEPGDQAVARVDGRTVWASDVAREAVAQGVIGEGEPLDPASDEFGPLLEQVIDQRLLAREAERRNLDDDPGVRRELEAARRKVLGDALVEREVAGAVDEGEVKRLYDEFRREQRDSEQVRVRRILAGTQADAQAARQAIEGGASFEAVAAERSTDAETRYSGGDLGYLDPQVLPEAYAAPLQQAPAGALLGPIAAEGGFAVLRVEDRRREPVRSIEELRPQILRFLSFDKVRELLQRLRKETEVERLDAPADGAPRAQEPASAPPGAPAQPKAKEAARP